MPTGTVTKNDVEQGWWFAGTALFGILKDTATLEERTAIYKKISAARVAVQQSNLAEQVLPPEFSDILDIINADPDELLEEKPVPGGTGMDNMVFKTPLCDKMLALHREGLKEVSKLMEKKILSGNFQSRAEQNYCYMLKSYIEDLAEGKSFTQSKLNNYQYMYSHAMTAKFRTTSTTVGLDENNNFKAIPTEIEDETVLKLLDSSGLIDAVAGGKKIADLTDNYKKNSDISIGELIEEYERQQERIKKHLELTEDEFNEINTRNPNVKVFDNEYKEIAGDDERGFDWAKTDINTKIDALKLGYPVSDLQALSAYKLCMDAISRETASSEKTIQTNEERIRQEQLKENPNQANIQAWKDEIDRCRETINTNNNAYEKMDEAWKNAMDLNDPVDLDMRRTNLQGMKSALDGLNDPEKFGRYANLLDERINARLEEHERTLLSSGATEMLERLNAVDPKLVKSSDQFKKFKEALVELQKMDDLENKDYAWQSEYLRLAQKVMETGSDYLRYKTRQLHRDPSHKRSELEERRVRTVDAIVGKLSFSRTPTGHLSICDDTFNPINTRGFKPDVVFDEAIDKSKKSYDSYIKLHTGRGAMNGNREEMLEDLAKVIAASALKKAYGEPYSKSEIDKQAKRIKVLYNLEAIQTKDLTDILATPKTVDSFIVKRQRELSEVPDLLGTKNEEGYPKQYSLWRNNISALYRVMKDPANVNSDAYTKLFEAVKEAAHLPYQGDAGKVNQKMLASEVARLNFKMMQYANIAVDEKGFQEKNMNHDSLHVLYTLAGFTKGAANIINDIDKRIDEKRYNKDPESMKFVSMGYYGAKLLYEGRKKLNGNKELRQPDDNVILKNTKKLLIKHSKEEMTPVRLKKAFNGKYAEAMKNPAKKKNAAKNGNEVKKAPKEAPAPANRPKL